MPVRTEPWAPGTPCWVDCQVEDPAAARSFYAELFGWDFLDTGAAGGHYLLALKDGHAAAGIARKPEITPGGGWLTYLASTDANETVRKAADAGGRVLSPPFDVMDSGRMAVVADPTKAVFGVWQADQHIGAGVYNEAGAYCWNELHTRDLDGAKTFYSSVFGYTFTDLGDGGSRAYATFAVPGDEGPAGGVNDESTGGPPTAGHPDYWLTWFQVDDVDAATEKVGALGGTVFASPADNPFGRMSVVRGVQNDVFGLIEPGAAAPQE